ncbi:MAG: helix-turn-helix domain-containing protein [Halobacteriales archaeon]|nr:helix-turn-helix domain-containing protein [Halobacteriales archaeon]
MDRLPPRRHPPAAPGASPLLTCHYAVLESQQGQWTLSALAVTARVLTLHGTLAGTLAVDHVDAASWNGTQLPTQAAIVEATGDFRLDTAFSDGTAVWHVQGMMASLKVDASAVPLVRASAAAGAAGVGAAAWLLRPWPVALYARVRALGGKTRHRILDELKARGGASAGELARSLRLHKTSVGYHLGVLARAGLVGRERVANRHYYVATGPGSGAALLGASLAENAVRRAILEALASGPLQTADLVARARLSAGRGGLSLVHYHAGILRGHGLVRATRRGHTYVWSLAAPAASALGAAATPQGGMPVAV